MLAALSARICARRGFFTVVGCEPCYRGAVPGVPARTSRILDLGGPVHVLEWGGDGAPIVMVHGATSCAATWTGLATRLAPRHRVIAPDLIGHGATPLAGRKATLGADAALVGRLLEREDLHGATIVAYTRGALVAAGVAKAHVRRVGGLVLFEPVVDAAGGLRATMANLMAGALSRMPRVFEAAAPRVFRVSEGVPAAVERWLRRASPHPERVEAGTRSAVEQAMAARLADHRPFLGWAQAFRELGPILIRGRAGRYYDGIAQPVFVVAGREQTSMSVEAVDALVKACPGWQLEIFESAGHPVLEAPEKAADAIVRWLDALARAS